MVATKTKEKLSPFQQEALRHLEQDRSRVDTGVWPERIYFTIMGMLAGVLYASWPAHFDAGLIQLSVTWILVVVAFLITYGGQVMLRMATPRALLSPMRIKRATHELGEMSRAGGTILIQLLALVGIFKNGHLVAGILTALFSFAYWGSEKSFRIKTLSLLERRGKKTMIDGGTETPFKLHWGPVVLSPALMEALGISEDDMVDIINHDGDRTIYRRVKEGMAMAGEPGQPNMLWINIFDASELHLANGSETLSVAPH